MIIFDQDALCLTEIDNLFYDESGSRIVAVDSQTGDEEVLGNRDDLTRQEAEQILHDIFNQFKAWNQPVASISIKKELNVVRKRNQYRSEDLVDPETHSIGWAQVEPVDDDNAGYEAAKALGREMSNKEAIAQMHRIADSLNQIPEEDREPLFDQIHAEAIDAQARQVEREAEHRLAKDYEEWLEEQKDGHDIIRPFGDM